MTTNLYAPRDHDYVVLKLCRSDTSNIKREIDMYRLLDAVKAKHPGTTLVRKMLDNFEIQDNRGHMYPCIVHKPLGMSLEKFRSRVPNNKLPEHILKLVLIHVLIALEFLHTKANIIHCGTSRPCLHTSPAKGSKTFKRKMFSWGLKKRLFSMRSKNENWTIRPRGRSMEIALFTSRGI